MPRARVPKSGGPAWLACGALPLYSAVWLSRSWKDWHRALIIVRTGNRRGLARQWLSSVLDLEVQAQERTSTSQPCC
jgi:predicted YcjX-like family ATPase